MRDKKSQEGSPGPAGVLILSHPPCGPPLAKLFNPDGAPRPSRREPSNADDCRLSAKPRRPTLWPWMLSDKATRNLGDGTARSANLGGEKVSWRASVEKGTKRLQVGGARREADARWGAPTIRRSSLGSLSRARAGERNKCRCGRKPGFESSSTHAQKLHDNASTDSTSANAQRSLAGSVSSACSAWPRRHMALKVTTQVATMLCSSTPPRPDTRREEMINDT